MPTLQRWFDVLRLRIRSFVSRETVDRDLDDELAFHLERTTDELVARGMAPHEARRAARLSLGGVEQRKEECREARGLRLLRALGRDLAFAGRMIRRRSGFSAAAIATLGLGIGANTAMFAILNGVLLQPLPFPEPERLVVLSSSPIDRVYGIAHGLSEEGYLVLRQGDRLFEHLAVFATTPANATGPGEPSRLKLATVTNEFFDVLGTAPALGRPFAPSDDAAAGGLIVVGDRFWRSHLEAASDAIGRSLAIDGLRHEVVGVMPPGFAFPDDADAWVLLDVRPQGGNSFTRPVIGRLRPGASIEQAEAELAALTRPRDATAENWQTVALSLKDRLVGDVRRPLLVLAGTVVFVLLIACLNAANLFLIRAAERERELAVRAALGAGRRRLLQQLFVECVVITAAAAALGVLLAAAAVPSILALAPPRMIPRVDLVRIDGVVLFFTAGLAGLTAVFFGLLPALRATVQRPWTASHRRSVSARHGRLHGVLVVAEIALSVVLLTGAGLMLKSFLQLRAVDTGFSTEGVLTATVDLPAESYATSAEIRGFYEDVLARLQALDSVQSAGTVNWLPFGDMTISGDFGLEGRTTPRGFNVDKPAVSADYFRAMGIRLQAGRAFTAADGPSAAPVAIVSRFAAESFWPGEDPIGQRLTLWRSQPWMTVVGVVDDVRQYTLMQDRSRAVYQPYGQVGGGLFLRRVTVVVRTTADLAAVGPAIRTAFRGADRNLPAPSVVPMDDIVFAQVASPAFQARVLAMFAGAALLLTLVGIYGVLAYSVSQRTREFGIRMALGAGAIGVVRSVAVRTLALTVGGVLIGVTGALAATRVLQRQLFDVTPTDPVTFAAVIALMVAAALVAAAVPAWRASRVDPTVVLRAE
jgi:predicted permease